MTKLALKLGLATTASLAMATSAHAHDGDHSGIVLANIIHWLSSPTHALFAVAGGLAVSVLIVKLARKNRA